MKPIIKLLRQAREAAHLTQAELAQRIGCSRDTIARIEIGRQEITLEQLIGYVRHCKLDLDNIIQALEQPQSTEFAYMLRMHDVHYITPQIKTQFEKWYKQCAEKYQKEKPVIVRQLPEFQYDENRDPREQGEEAAVQTRQLWRLGTAPISDPVELISALGIYIAGADLGVGELFALTGKRHDTDQYGMLININPAITIERQRFSIIHELGHLVAHRDEFSVDFNETGKGRNKEKKEIFADSFAGAFLVPAEELQNFMRLARNQGIGDIGELIIKTKRYFGVSYQTILLRLRTIGFFKNERQFGILYGKLKKALGPNEPQPITIPLKFNQLPTFTHSNLPFQMVE